MSNKHYMRWIRTINLENNASLTRVIEPEEEQSIRNAAHRFNKTYGFHRGIFVSVHFEWVDRTITIAARMRTDCNLPLGTTIK